MAVAERHLQQENDVALANSAEKLKLISSSLREAVAQARLSRLAHQIDWPLVSETVKRAEGVPREVELARLKQDDVSGADSHPAPAPKSSSPPLLHSLKVDSYVSCD